MDQRLEEITHDTPSMKGLGFIKIWQSNPETGESKLVLEKRNTILYDGSDLLAKALGAQANTGISHMYLGYSNNDTNPDSDYTIAKNNPVFVKSAERGYLRVPLTFPASFTKSDNNYGNNIVAFTVLINNAASYVVPSSATLSTGSPQSKFFEAGLVAAIIPSATLGSHTTDVVFARIAFDRISYDPAFNLTVTWGIKFTS
jgi:hypothetical protein